MFPDDVRLQELERWMARASDETITTIREYLARNNAQIMRCKAIDPATARALVLQNERRVEDAHRLFDFLGVGRGSPEEALMVKELQFEHSMTGNDPAMAKFEEIGRRMFKSKRRDETKLLQPLKLARLGDTPPGFGGFGGVGVGGVGVGGVGGVRGVGGFGGLGGSGGRLPFVEPANRFCHWCKQQGHVMAECPARLAGAAKVQAPTPFAVGPAPPPPPAAVL